MGREIKRVPLDFSAPLEKEWAGFENPHFKPCPEENRNCFGGWTGAGKWLSTFARLLAILGEEALEEPRADALRTRGRTFPHPYLAELPTAPHKDVPREVHERLMEIADERTRIGAFNRYQREHPRALVPFGEETIRLIEGLSRLPRAKWGLGSDLGYRIEKRLRTLAGVGEDFGECPVCKGEGIDPAVREAYEAWQDEPVPTGEGWQLWETVSRGSPISPVFATADELIDWMCQPVPMDKRRHYDPSPFPSMPWAQGWRREVAEPFVKKHGWAPSAVFAGGKMMSGAEAVVSLDKEA